MNGVNVELIPIFSCRFEAVVLPRCLSLRASKVHDEAEESRLVHHMPSRKMGNATCRGCVIAICC